MDRSLGSPVFTKWWEEKLGCRQLKIVNESSKCRLLLKRCNAEIEKNETGTKELTVKSTQVLQNITKL